MARTVDMPFRLAQLRREIERLTGRLDRLQDELARRSRTSAIGGRAGGAGRRSA